MIILAFQSPSEVSNVLSNVTAYNKTLDKFQSPSEVSNVLSL